MESRKIIKLGNSSYAIALPKDWVDKSGLKKGDSIYVLPNSNGEIIITPKYSEIRTEKSKKLDVSDKSYKEIEREIIAAYIQGNSLLEIPISSKQEAAYVSTAIKRLASFELIEYNATKLIAKDLLDIHSISIENIMRRTDNILRSLFDDVEVYIKIGSATSKQLQEALEADKEINKFYFLLWRMMATGLDNPSIISGLHTDYKGLFISWHIGVNIESIGDELKRITRVLTKKKLEKTEKERLLEAYLLLKENYTHALNAYYKQDEAMSLSVARNKGKIIASCDLPSKEKNVKLEEIYHRMKIIASNIHNITKSALYFMR